MLVAQPTHPLFAQMPARRRVAILGSTGSIGCSAIDVLSRSLEDFEVVGLFAGKNEAVLWSQAETVHPKVIGLDDQLSLKKLSERCDSSQRKYELLGGRDEICDFLRSSHIDVVLCAVVGMAGLPYVLAALESGKFVALANKESIVAGSAFVASALAQHCSALVPVDSEHSAIFQLLEGRNQKELERIILTASGGPFLHTPKEELKLITPAQAVAHPRWSMGAKISVDSSTLMNKALEVIEAHFLFGVSPEKISVLVHPQSIVHSLLELRDGALLAQLSVPDMRQPIAHALSFGKGRLANVIPRLRVEDMAHLDFYALDRSKFPAVDLAYQAMKAGPSACFLLNLANEVAVDAFLAGRISYLQISAFVTDTLADLALPIFRSVEELFATERELRQQLSNSLLKKV
jgi:1-deoxy-D-xylulose-5-phosphate reductoisomerase